MEPTRVEDVTKRYTLEEYMQSDEPFEIIDGERIDQLPTKPRHTIIQQFFQFRLYDFLKENPVGYQFMEFTFIYEMRQDWVRGSRIADLCVYAKDRWEAYKAQHPDYDMRPNDTVPDLVIEILSPTDDLLQTMGKIRRDLEHGVQVAWMIDPDARLVDVFTPQGWQRLTDDAVLDGGAVLPGFRVPLPEIWAALD